MVGLIQDDTDLEMTRYNEAAHIKQYSGLSANTMRGGTVRYDPIRKVDEVYVDLPSGGKLRVGDRPVQTAQADILTTQTDATAAAPAALVPTATPAPVSLRPTAAPVAARQPIAEYAAEQRAISDNGPTAADFEAAGYTAEELAQYQQSLPGPEMVPTKLTPAQVAEYAKQPGAQVVYSKDPSLAENMQAGIYNTLDPNREQTGGVMDTVSSVLQDLIGKENLTPSMLSQISGDLTQFADFFAPGIGGAMSIDEGTTMIDSGYAMMKNGLAQGDTGMAVSGLVDATLGSVFTGLGVAELVPMVKGLTKPARELLSQASPAAKNLLADTIGASRAITQGDKDMLMEIFQPAGTPRSLGAAADTSYRMQQQPRGPQDESPIRLDNLTKSTTGENAGYPADFYSANGPRIYAPGPQFAGDEFGQANRESYKAIMAVKGKPDAEVTIYRAVPNDPKITSINEGDFVTLSPTYAKLHGASGYGPKGEDAGKIISQKVKVKDIYFDGNDVNEFGYFPETAAPSSAMEGQ